MASESKQHHWLEFLLIAALVAVVGIISNIFGWKTASEIAWSIVAACFISIIAYETYSRWKRKPREDLFSEGSSATWE
jgi:FtsH-binding integral membrane protein